MPDLSSTARLQLHAGFDLKAATATVAYYAALGVSHLYLSPIATAVAGSMHGYDVIDPTRVNPQLGGEPALRDLAFELRRHDMGMIVDIVPNHMAASVDNPWWRDVLANGRESIYADYFDIDWQAPFAEGKVWLPMLGDTLIDAVEKGTFYLDKGRESAEPVLSCDGVALPLSAAGIASLLTATGLKNHQRESRDALLSLWRRATHDHRERCRIDEMISVVNRDSTRLLALIDLQHYRPAWWRTGNDVINYRRFFDISALAALAIERAHVFDAVHALPLRLIAEGMVDGLRIDHVDGLSAPGQYLRRLREAVAVAQSRRGNKVPSRIAIHVEKILAHGELLRADWPVDGTTGYEFMDVVSAVFHDPDGEVPLRQAWKEVSGRSGDFRQEERQARQEMIAGSLYAEVHTALRAWWTVAAKDRAATDLTLHSLELALARWLECMPVYRTYLGDDACADSDRKVLTRAFADASVNAEHLDGLIPLRDWLLGPSPGSNDTVSRLRQARRRLEQVSAPLNAKAVEDTAFYRHGVLMSRNEVGSHPDVFTCPVDDFHAAMLRRARSWPRALSTMATHDHKRGEDTRARLAVIAQQATRFIGDASRWIARWGDRRCALTTEIDPGDIWMFLQNVLGVWPLDLDIADSCGMQRFYDRMSAWQQKALREAKIHTSWTAPNEAYEHACSVLLRAWLLDDAGKEARKELQLSARMLDVPGALVGLSMTVLHMMAPGIPDLYQGTERWDQSLVDPDNRRPVDYDVRRAALSSTEDPGAMVREFRDGRIKQWIIGKLLKLRREYPRLFLEGDYRPVAVTGDFSDRVIAFLRRAGNERCIVVVPRLCSDWLTTQSCPSIPVDRWKETALQLEADDAVCTYRHVFVDGEKVSGNAIPIRKLLGVWPVSVLISR